MILINYYFTYKYGHQNWGGWIRVIAFTWKAAMTEYEDRFGRDYLNFYEESLFKKEKYPKGEILVL